MTAIFDTFKAAALLVLLTVVPMLVAIACDFHYTASGVIHCEWPL